MLAGRRISGLVTRCIQALPTGVAVGGDRTGLTANHGLALSARRALNASFLDAMTVTLVLLCRSIATEASHGGVQVCVRLIVARCLPSAPMSSSQQKQREMSLVGGRLIDSYAEGLIEKGEFEPRVGGSKSVWRGLKHKPKISPKKPPWRPICG
jgi:hypothetical protein